MQMFYKLFKQDPQSRDSIIAMTSGLGILVNVVLSLMKIVIGLMVSSIAIVSEGANNAADVLSSLLTFIAAKLSCKHPDEKHPFGYGRIEYLASLIVSGLIVLTAYEMISNAISLVLHPEPVFINYLALAIVAGSAVVKYVLGVYTIQMGKKAGSNALIGVGTDCRGDAYASIVTIASSIVFLVWNVSLDAYAGIIISLLIFKAGFELMKDTVEDLLGRPGEHDLAVNLYQIIRGTDGVLSAADMMLHNYGPDAWSGSVNVEMDHKKTVGEVYQVLHDLQLRIMHEYHVTMVFGIYAVNNDYDHIKQLRTKIGEFVRKTEHVNSYHAVYVSEREHKIYVDFIVDYALKDWEALRQDFLDYIKMDYPGYAVELTVETDFV